jgi:hypothetical protein
MIAEMANMDEEMVRQILHDRSNMRKVFSKMDPKNLTQELKDNQKNICSDIMKRITEQLDALENVITCDETWIFQYNLETKRQSSHWKTPTSPRMKKARMSKSNVKAMIVVFFNIRGVIIIQWEPEGQTVNRKFYLEVLTKLQEQVGKKKPEMWKKKSWILHQDNVPAHNTLTVKQFLADKCVPVLQHFLYSLDLAPCDF